MTPQNAPLPQFVRDLLASPPRRGGGLNSWLFRVARALHPYRTPPEIVATLAAATAGEPVKPGEIERAVANSAATAWQPGDKPHFTRQAPAWPAVNTELREAITARGGLDDLWKSSPNQIGENKHTEEIIDRLFPGNPWLCVGASNRDFKTRRCDELRGELSALALIVPSPMTARTGKTKDGKTSEHALDNTGERRFLVVEFDTGTADEQAVLLLHLATMAPLALAVHSGGKSLHGWFFCAGQSEEITRRFMRYAVSLGADSATWTRCQFVRIPDGTRDNGEQQTVHFFNPAVVEAAQ